MCATVCHVRQPEVDVDAVARIVSTVPGAELLSNVGTELSFRLPMHESGKFPAMLQAVSPHLHFSHHAHSLAVRRLCGWLQLDAQLKPLGLISYGIGVTTMEEVFLRVAQEQEEELELQQQTAPGKQLDPYFTTLHKHYCSR